MSRDMVIHRKCDKCGKDLTGLLTDKRIEVIVSSNFKVIELDFCNYKCLSSWAESGKA